MNASLEQPILCWVGPQTHYPHGGPLHNGNAHKVDRGGSLMSRHVSVVMRDDLFAMLEKERGRESKSSFMNFVLERYFNEKKGEKNGG